MTINFDSQHHARVDWLAIDQNGAGSALSRLATVLCAGESEFIAQHLEQRHMRRNCDNLVKAVYGHRYCMKCHNRLLTRVSYYALRSVAHA
jgi:hypothetical protein